VNAARWIGKRVYRQILSQRYIWYIYKSRAESCVLYKLNCYSCCANWALSPSSWESRTHVELNVLGERERKGIYKYWEKTKLYNAVRAQQKRTKQKRTCNMSRDRFIFFFSFLPSSSIDVVYI
jgi:hypothetical protein